MNHRLPIEQDILAAEQRIEAHRRQLAEHIDGARIEVEDKLRRAATWTPLVLAGIAAAATLFVTRSRPSAGVRGSISSSRGVVMALASAAGAALSAVGPGYLSSLLRALTRGSDVR